MLTAMSWIFVIPFIIALSVFSIETILGVSSQGKVDIEIGQPKTIILMPAHNEETNIATTLKNLQPILSDMVRVLVVADNCDDNTAARVREMGLDVIERQAPTQRGKGFALAYGQDHLRSNPPECVIILDADCTTDCKSISDLAKFSLQSGSPVQAQYLFYSDSPQGPMVQISNFAFWIKNAVRQRGVSRMGGPAILGGTGMAFPWSLFETLPLATSSIVEDLTLGIYLTKKGRPPVYLDQALVLSKAADEKETINQRSRWEIGYLSMAREFGLTSLGTGIYSLDRNLLQLGLHLIVPPLALLLGITLLIIPLTIPLAIMANNVGPLALLVVALMTAVVCIFIAWIFGGHHYLNGRTFVRLPLYLIWKIPIYLKFVKGEVPEWERTKRANETDN